MLKRTTSYTLFPYTTLFRSEEQREVAKLFMTAFFERIFNKDRTFEDVFRNHFFVKDYLPDTNIVTKYNHASYRVIESFEDDFSYEKAEGFDELEDRKSVV